MRKIILGFISILVLIGELTGCGGHPMSMAGFMRGDDHFALTTTLLSGDIKDSTIDDENSMDYTNYQELPLYLDAFRYFTNDATHLRMGFGIGFQGLTYEVGYLGQQFGLMTWINAGYGFPNYGAQFGYSMVNIDELKIGPVAYYSRNEIMKTEGERHSFEMSETSHGYKYNEFGGGLYMSYTINEKWALLVDYKLGLDPEYNRYRNYFTAAITLLE